MSRPWDLDSARVALALAIALTVCAAGLAGCKMPPALTKAQLDAGKLPQKHRKLTAQQQQNCRLCHREAPAIRKP